jgi:hypothetical protein
MHHAQANSAATVCNSCIPISTSTDARSTACRCNAGYARVIDIGCILCVPGKFAPISATSCVDCVPGKYGDREGATDCQDCAKVDTVNTATSPVESTAASQCVCEKGYSGSIDVSATPPALCQACAPSKFLRRVPGIRYAPTAPRTRPRLRQASLRRPALANQATVATLTHLIAYCAPQASTNLQELVIARTATRARTGLLQDNPEKHRARAAARASTGLLQDKPLKHRALTVPTTRTRLFRALLRPPARAMQATVAMPAQEHVQRAKQARTNMQPLLRRPVSCVLQQHLSPGTLAVLLTTVGAP